MSRKALSCVPNVSFPQHGKHRHPPRYPRLRKDLKYHRQRITILQGFFWNRAIYICWDQIHCHQPHHLPRYQHTSPPKQDGNPLLHSAMRQHRKLSSKLPCRSYRDSTDQFQKRSQTGILQAFMASLPLRRFLYPHPSRKEQLQHHLQWKLLQYPCQVVLQAKI